MSMHRVKFIREVRIEDWYASSALLSSYYLENGTLVFNTLNSDFSEELRRNHRVVVPLSNVVSIVTE